jgi:hypothetical protein
MQNRLVLVLFVIGCGGGGVSIGDLPDELEDAQCANAVACQGIADKTTCENAVDFDDEDYRTIKAGIEDGTIKYDGDAAAECVDAFGDTDCSFAGFHDEDPCEDMFEGTVATGGACVIDLQCANGGECVVAGSCDSETTCCTGVCMGSLVESPVGGPCGDDLHVCAFDTFCKTSETGPGTCTALITTEGSPCDEIDACANPMYCNVLTGSPTCKKAAASGATCSRMDLLACADFAEVHAARRRRWRLRRPAAVRRLRELHRRVVRGGPPRRRHLPEHGDQPGLRRQPRVHQRDVRAAAHRHDLHAAVTGPIE